MFDDFGYASLANVNSKISAVFRLLDSNTSAYLSNGAKWLFVVLNELEQRYTGKGCDFFYRTDAELANDANLSLATLKRYKAELRNTQLVQMWNGHFVDKDGKKSEKKFSYYRILK